MRHDKLLARLAAGHLQNVRFKDFTGLVTAFGFRLARIDGSHHIYLHDGVAEQINLQEIGGEANLIRFGSFSGSSNVTISV